MKRLLIGFLAIAGLSAFAGEVGGDIEFCGKVSLVAPHKDFIFVKVKEPFILENGEVQSNIRDGFSIFNNEDNLAVTLSAYGSNKTLCVVVPLSTKKVDGTYSKTAILEGTSVYTKD